VRSDAAAKPSPGPGAGPRAGARSVVVWAVLVRPDLWWTALCALRRLVPAGWWRAGPHLPLPDGRLWAFRMVTAYGNPDAVPRAPDVISYLEWCRSTARSRLANGSRS